MSDHQEAANISNTLNQRLSSCGALLGAVNGLSTIPERWLETLRNCRPENDAPGVYQPRPECFWPVDALELAAQLVKA